DTTPKYSFMVLQTRILIEVRVVLYTIDYTTSWRLRDWLAGDGTILYIGPLQLGVPRSMSCGSNK
ncbi:hypothetical protein MKX03_028129, partial [Papaver bracteatum]